MKLGEFFKNYNIRVANFYPIKHNLKIYNTDLNTKTIKNFLDLKKFFDQNNIVYVHVDKKSKSLMLDKKKSVHQLKF